jgi:hypothetical protein
MALLKMPKTIRWVGICALLMLVIMSLYRFTVYQFFPEVFVGVKSNSGQAFWYGLRFDARLVAMVSLFMLLLSFWPGLHFFKWTIGKKMALFLYGFFFTIILLFCVMDVGYLHSFGLRLQGSLVSDIAKGTEKWKAYNAGTAWIPLVAGMGVLAFAFIFLINKFHKSIGKSRGTDSHNVRRFWQISTVLICLILIHGRFAKQPLSFSLLSKRLPAGISRLSANPFESLYSSLPAIK